MNLFLLYFNVVTDLLIVITLMGIMQQNFHDRTRVNLYFRISLAMIALPYLIKVHERVCHHDLPTIVDAVRDLGILALFSLVIWFHSERFD